MIKGSVGGQARNRGKSTRKMKGETIRYQRQLQTDRSYLIKIRNCLFEDDGSDKNTLTPFDALTTFKKNNLVADIEFTTGAYLDKLEISTLKRVRKHAAPRASFFGTSCFGVEDARFLIVRGYLKEEDEEQHQEEETAVESATPNTESENANPNDADEDDEAAKPDKLTTEEMKEVEATLKELNLSDDDEVLHPVIGYVRFFYTLQGELIDRNTGQPCLMIQDLFVEPKFQHRGLGKHLVQLCELMSRSLTLPMMYVVSTKSMEENLRGFLNEKLNGYTEDDGSEFLDRPMSVMLPHLIAFVKRFDS